MNQSSGLDENLQVPKCGERKQTGLTFAERYGIASGVGILHCLKIVHAHAKLAKHTVTKVLQLTCSKTMNRSKCYAQTKFKRILTTQEFLNRKKPTGLRQSSSLLNWQSILPIISSLSSSLFFATIGSSLIMDARATLLAGSSSRAFFMSATEKLKLLTAALCLKSA